MSALLKAKQETLALRLAALSQPAGGSWVSAARADALARLQAMGLPGRRDEYWRYTDPAAFNAVTPAAVTPAAADAVVPFDAIERVKLYFVDGVYDAARSDSLELAGVELSRLADVAGTDSHWAAELYGKLEANGQKPVERPFAVLNTAFAADGLLIRVTGQAERPLSLIYEQSSETSDVLLHHVLKLEEGAEFTLLENGVGAARFNSVMEVEVGKGATFHHVRTQGRDSDRSAITHIFARIGSESTFKSFTMTANGTLTRNEAVLDLTGDDAFAHIAGACVGDAGVKHDDTVFIIHGAERCESRQVFKKVLMNGATGIFQGKILVKPGAQKTDGYQISQSLLLDGDSQFLAKPELEIYADDVKCSHGSTSGAIDETALYYLRSRGVPKRQAEALLVLAFLAEAIGEIDDETLGEEIRGRLESWLTRHTND
ncbi:Fe-S cluster assembly protein SufD [Falsigemmobacter intermedius]|uniref:Fe-S cluster assembly protein SufD n=1 Tax=Falsigemmobacter intermedius TaxID=1553448 RepID=UPI003F08A404